MWERKHLLRGLIGLFALCGCQTDNEMAEPQPREYTQIFWTSLGDEEILRAVYQADVLADIDTLYGPIKGLEAPSAVVADERTQSLYWTDFATRQILRGPWDGQGNPEVLYTVPQRFDGPVELALDPVEQQLYWTQPFDNLILRAPANGSGPVDTLFDADNGVNGAWGIGLQLAAGYLYWVEYQDMEVYRASLDQGASPQLLYREGSGFLRPFGLAIDERLGDIFIVDNPFPGSSHSDRILRGSLDGSEPLQIVYALEDGVDNAYNLAIDQGYLYWHNQLSNGSIYRGSPDASTRPELLLEGINIGQGLAVVRSVHLNL